MNDPQTALSDLKRIIREASYENTYKMAWAKALVELSLSLKKQPEDPVVIPLKTLAPLMIKYYWNQTIFFDLVQGSNPKKPPLLLQYAKELIERFYILQGDRKPVIFEKAVLILNDKDPKSYPNFIKKSVRAIKANVAYRFTHLNDKEITSVYSYAKDGDDLTIPKANIQTLADNAQDLFDLINYRWSLILETFNSSPRINKKVRIMDERDIKRSPLQRFDRFLDVENPGHICFICGKPIRGDQLSRDHVIPWSYLFSDDLWNLVYVHKDCNSSKSNVIPNDEAIEKLKERNTTLLEELRTQKSGGKEVEELDVAIRHDLVDQFYIGCKR